MSLGARCVLLACLWQAGCAVAQFSRPSAVFDRQQLLEDLRILAADDMEGREVGTAGGSRARMYVVRRFREAGIEPVNNGYEHAFAVAGSRVSGRAATQGVNVLGQIRGTTFPGRYVVVSAHYDHQGVRGGQVFNGANDNASGTAALFAVGAFFHRHRPSNTLVLAAFDAEETGRRGAKAFIERPPVDLVAVVVNVNLDMIGRDPTDRLYVAGTYAYPFLKPYVMRVAERAPVKLLVGHDDPTQNGVEDWTSSSDHSAFHTRRIPFLYLGVEDFENHHRPTDDFETITQGFYVRAVETAIDLLRTLDANLERIARDRALVQGK
jgi:hypothetical protein